MHERPGRQRGLRSRSGSGVDREDRTLLRSALPDLVIEAAQVTVMFRGVSTSGTDKIAVQLGTPSGCVTTGYVVSASVNGAV